MSDEFWALRDDVSADDIPVAELGAAAGGPPPTARPPRSRRVAVGVLVVALLTAGGVVAARASDGGHKKVATDPQRVAKHADDGQAARADVFAALQSTTASGSFKIKFHLTAKPGPVASATTTVPCTAANGLNIGGDNIVCSGDFTSAPNTNVTIAGEGVVHVDPTAMVTTAQIPNLGEITTRIDGTRVWEDGGANYGMTPSSNNGPGSPLSEFAGLVMGTLGRREGAIAMTNMASPTGYLNFAKDAITESARLADGSVDGVPVHVYEVGIDTMKALERPGLTDEETKTTAAALTVLEAEGYASTSVRLSIDGLGFIREGHTVVTFRDGGTVTGDTTFSDFGCSTVVALANGPSILPAPAGCTSVPGGSVRAKP